MALTITLAQLNPVLGDITYNKSRILETWKAAKSDLVVFPELFLSGYPTEDLVRKPAFMDAIEAALADIVKQSAGFKAGAIITTPQRLDGKIFNAAHVIENGRIVASVQKYHLPNYGVFDEMRVFSSAPLPQPVKFRGHTLGLMICEDMWFSNIAEHLKSQGAEILIVPNGSPYDADKSQNRTLHARNRIKETGLPLVYLNQVGGQDEIVFDGASFVMNAKGEAVLKMALFREDIQMVDFPLTLPPAGGAARNRLEDIYNALVLGLRDYVRKNKFPGILLGVSGGIDSALAAVIAVDAVGAENVHGVMMPTRFTSEESFHDAAALCANLDMKLDTIPVEEPVEVFNRIISAYAFPAKAGTLGPEERSLLSQGKQQDITFQNIQPRTRGIILMALSNATGKMVLSTGNKSEMAVGYATLYGDMCGGFNVLKDVYKTLVYELSRWRNKDGVIPERIFTKAPTAELKPNQTDQDTLPPYDELDKILTGLIEGEKSVDDLVKAGHKRETVVKTWKMLDGAEYKRRQAPPGVKITARAFGRERRYPMTNRFISNLVD